MNRSSAFVVALATLFVLVGPIVGYAQEARDTVRIATLGQTVSAVTAEAPLPETDLVAGAVFDSLVCYDVANGTFHPLLAKSWKQTGPLTTEFELRHDVKWQDGSPFTAADVVYTFKYYANPASKLRFAPQNFKWLAHVAALGPYRVRVVAKRVDPLELLNIATLGDILPKKLHSSYANRADFGRLHPIGTGPYKVVSIDPGKGVVLERNPEYHHGNPCKPAGKIQRIDIVPIPDAQTRMAQLVTGGVDLIQAMTRDDRDMMAANPQFAVTSVANTGFVYFMMDAQGRAGQPALAKEQVRQAIVQAIDRLTVARDVLPGGPTVQIANDLCAPLTRACDVSVKPYPFDPTAAKKLLAAAGYANGFDLTLTAGLGFETLAEAISGELRKIGIRAKVEPLSVGPYFQAWARHKIEAGVGVFGLPDVATNAELFFNGGPFDDWHDPIIEKAVAEGRETDDLAQRKADYRTAFDRMNKEAYILPISTDPAVFLHSKDLVVPQVANNRYGFDLNELHWAKGE
jgi:peptide/nickel transport system substrate-binding protein